MDITFLDINSVFTRVIVLNTCLLVMIEKWKKTVDDGGVFGVLLTDLSKAFDCIPHDIIIAKLEAYGFHIDALKLIHDYLSNRKQRVKVNDTYSLWISSVFHMISSLPNWKYMVFT